MPAKRLWCKKRRKGVNWINIFPVVPQCAMCREKVNVLLTAKGHLRTRRKGDNASTTLLLCVVLKKKKKKIQEGDNTSTAFIVASYWVRTSGQNVTKSGETNDRRR